MEYLDVGGGENKVCVSELKSHIVVDPKSMTSTPIVEDLDCNKDTQTGDRTWNVNSCSGNKILLEVKEGSDSMTQGGCVSELKSQLKLVKTCASVTKTSMAIELGCSLEGSER